MKGKKMPGHGRQPWVPPDPLRLGMRFGKKENKQNKSGRRDLCRRPGGGGAVEVEPGELVEENDIEQTFSNLSPKSSELRDVWV